MNVTKGKRAIARIGTTDVNHISPWKGLTYELRDPWFIGSNLRPTVNVPNVYGEPITISLWASVIGGRDGIKYGHEVRHNGVTVFGAHADMGCGSHTIPDLDDAMGSLLSFLSHYGEVYAHTMRHGSVDELESLPAHYEWCYQWSDELVDLQMCEFSDEFEGAS